MLQKKAIKKDSTASVFPQFCNIFKSSAFVEILVAVNYFHKKLDLRSLTKLEIGLYILSKTLKIEILKIIRVVSYGITKSAYILVQQKYG